MSKPRLSYETTLFVRDTCLCFAIQRVARGLARRFDEALRPLDITNHQFSLMMSLNRPQPAAMGDVADLLGIDRTTLTAALKPLERRGLVSISADSVDKRSRRLALTDTGHALLLRALPIWKRRHGQIEKHLGPANADRLREELQFLTRLL